MIGCHSVVAHERQQKKEGQREKKRLYSPGAAVLTSLATDCGGWGVEGGGQEDTLPTTERDRKRESEREEVKEMRATGVRTAGNRWRQRSTANGRCVIDGLIDANCPKRSELDLIRVQ